MHTSTRETPCPRGRPGTVHYPTVAAPLPVGAQRGRLPPLSLGPPGLDPGTPGRHGNAHYATRSPMKNTIAKANQIALVWSNCRRCLEELGPVAGIPCGGVHALRRGGGHDVPFIAESCVLKHCRAGAHGRRHSPAHAGQADIAPHNRVTPTQKRTIFQILPPKLILKQMGRPLPLGQVGGGGRRRRPRAARAPPDSGVANKQLGAARFQTFSQQVS